MLFQKNMACHVPVLCLKFSSWTVSCYMLYWVCKYALKLLNVLVWVDGVKMLFIA